MTTATPEQIADRLRIALEIGGESYVTALAEHWGEGAVDVTHEPPLPTDKPMNRAAMQTERRQLNSAFGALMSDFKYIDVYSRVVGDVIFLFADQVGTLADGKRVRSPLCSRFSVVNGKIEKVVLNIDLVSVAPLHRAFTALVAATTEAH